MRKKKIDKEEKEEDQENEEDEGGKVSLEHQKFLSRQKNESRLMKTRLFECFYHIQLSLPLSLLNVLQDPSSRN